MFPEPLTDQLRAARSRSELSTTEIDEALIAKAANIGLTDEADQGAVHDDEHHRLALGNVSKRPTR